MIALQSATDARGFQNLNAAAAAASKTFRDAASSTGMFEVQQLRLNSATDDYVKKLKAQKLGLREIMKSRKVAAAAYKEQLAMENMTVRQGVGSNRHNKGVYDVIIPKEVSADLDTAAKRLAFMNAELKSGAHQMVNWGKNTQWAGRQLMVGFTMPIAAFGAAAGVMAYQVDKELTRIAKVYDTVAQDSMGVEKELKQVRVDSLQTATTAAAEYGQAAKDTLNVQAELAATGKQGNELQKSTLEVMRIARLGEVDNNTAIEATIALQSIWRMSNEELTESFNFMNSIENATSLSTADFAEAIPVAASSVKAFGGDVKELGILLTAMKENGIGASEGANALKATMQRLGRPSKQIREEWQQLTGTDITKLVDESDGLVEVFTAINAATKDLDPDSQRKAFAGLFGSYQVSKMMALTKGMGELQQGIGQVSTAYEVSNQSAEDWAATADKEIKRYQKSISGMWDTAFNSMIIELAELGEPFVELATVVVKGIGAVLKAFNDMPDIAKKFIAGGVAVTALAGGVLMLAGLFGNLTGNLLKGVANLVNFATKIDLVSKESKVAALAAEATSNAYLEQANSVSMLTMQIEKLTAAQVESNQVMLSTNPAFAGMPPGMSTQQMLARQKTQSELDREKEAFRKPDYQGAGAYFVAPPGSNYVDKNGNKRTRISEIEAEGEAQKRIDARNMAAKQAQLDADADGNKLRAQANELEAKKNKRIVAGTAMLAVEGAAMATMMFSSNETLNSMAQIAMVAGLVAPAFSLLVPVAKMAGKQMGLVKTAMIDGAKGAGLLRGGVAGAGRAILGMMGPVGWIVTGLTVAGGILYKIIQKEKEAREQAIADQKTLNNLANDYATRTGKALNNYKSLRNVMLGIDSKKEATNFDKDLEYFKTEGSEGGAGQVEVFKELDSDTARMERAMEMFVDLTVRGEMTAQRAGTALRAMFIAANYSAEDANAAVEDLINNTADLRSGNYEDVFSAARENMLDAMKLGEGRTGADYVKENMKEYADEIAGTFSQAMAEADPGEGTAIFEDFQIAAEAGWNDVWKNVVSGNADAMEILKNEGVTTLAELQEWYKVTDPNQQALVFSEMFGGSGQGILDSIGGAAEVEAQIVGRYAKEYGKLGDNVSTVSQLLSDVNIKTKLLSKEEVGNEMEQLAAATKNFSGRGMQGGAQMSKEMALVQMNAYLAAHGIEEASTVAEALDFWLNSSKHQISGAASATGALKGGLNSAAGAARSLKSIMAGMNTEQIADAARAAVEGMQQDMADGWSDQMDANHEAATEALNDEHEAESDALSDRLDRESAALDAAWEGKRQGLENYWDERVEGVERAIEVEEKAEEKRQKMFDNEIARINRLAGIANTGIDFNVAMNEGNLDEAAKISNSAQAENAEFIINRERDAGADKSAARVDRLGKKGEALGEKRDAAMEAFDKREERAKAYFDSYREMEEESLADTQEAEKAAEQTRQENQKKSLQKILDSFLASTPTTKKALQNQVKELGDVLANFGITIVDPQSKEWGRKYRTGMREGILNGLKEAMTDDLWNSLARSTKDKMLEGWGFNSDKEYLDFINGKSDGDAGARDALYGSDKYKYDGDDKTGPPNSRRVVRHAGGPIMGGVDSRAGIAKNYKGLHPSEIDITARKGEYIMNEDAAAKYRSQLDAMNAGRGVGGKYGIAGRLGGMFVGSIAKGLMKKGKQNLKARAQTSGAGGGFSAAGYTPGQGGWQKPTTPGLGWSNTHDYGAPTGTPIYALSDGVVSDSRAITSGGSPGNGSTTPSGVPYRSYGETIGLRAADGSLFRYAHLSARYVGAGQSVKGGALIGRTGYTGNATGPHLHMDVNGNYNASGYLASRGVALKKGAEYVKFDNTLANLHRGESVMTKNITNQLQEGAARFASGPSSEYNVTVNIDGYNGDTKALARAVVVEIKKTAARAPQSRTVGNGG